MDFHALLYHAGVISDYVVITVRMVAFGCPLNPVTAYVVDFHIVLIRLFQHWVIIVVEICWVVHHDLNFLQGNFESHLVCGRRYLVVDGIVPVVFHSGMVPVAGQLLLRSVHVLGIELLRFLICDHCLDLIVVQCVVLVHVLLDHLQSS